jgi:hypothetical protein
MKTSMKARRRLEVVVVVGAAVVRRRLERDLWDARLIGVVVELLKLCCDVGSRRRGAWYPWPRRDVSHVRLRAIREVGDLCAHYWHLAPADALLAQVGGQLAELVEVEITMRKRR